MRMLMLILNQNTKIGDPVLGIIIPGIILLVSVVLTWALYKRFSKKTTDHQNKSDH